MNGWKAQVRRVCADTLGMQAHEPYRSPCELCGNYLTFRDESAHCHDCQRTTVQSYKDQIRYIKRLAGVARADRKRLTLKLLQLDSGKRRPPEGVSRDEQRAKYQELLADANARGKSLGLALNEVVDKYELVHATEVARELRTDLQTLRECTKNKPELTSAFVFGYLKPSHVQEAASAYAKVYGKEQTAAHARTRKESMTTLAERRHTEVVHTPLDANHKHPWHGRPSAPPAAAVQAIEDIQPGEIIEETGSGIIYKPLDAHHKHVWHGKVSAPLAGTSLEKVEVSEEVADAGTIFEPLDANHKHAWHGKPSRFAPGYMPPPPSAIERMSQVLSPARLAPSRWHLHRYEELRTEDVQVRGTRELLQRSEQRCRCGAEREVLRKYLLVGTRTVSIKRVQSGSFDIEGTVVGEGEHEVRSVDFLQRQLDMPRSADNPLRY